VPKPENMYKAGHALTWAYLLLKESVANDVINVSLFAYDENRNYVKNFKC